MKDNILVDKFGIQKFCEISDKIWSKIRLKEHEIGKEKVNLEIICFKNKNTVK